jgi:hypothetical protein
MLAHQASKLLPATNMFAGGTALTLGSTAAAALPATVAAPALAAGVAGPVAAGGSAAGGAALGVNPYVMLAVAAFSYLRNKSKKKKAKRLNQKVAREIGEEDTRLYEERSDKLQENRDDMLAQAGSYQHGQDAARYNNQYGGNYSNRYQYHKGGHAPEEINQEVNEKKTLQDLLYGKDLGKKESMFSPEALEMLNEKNPGMFNRTNSKRGNFGSPHQLPQITAVHPMYNYFNPKPTNYGGPQLNKILQEKVTFDKGGKLSPKEMKKVQNLGRRGDTMLAHINPQEAEMLKAMGGSGTINPYTGLREYNWFTDILGGVGDVVSTVGGGILDVISGGNDALGDPLGALGNGVSAVGGALNDNLIDPVVGGALDAAGNLIDGTLDGVKSLGHDVLIPIARPILGAGINVLEGIAGMFSGGDDGQIQANTGEAMDPTKRGADVRTKAGDSPSSGIKINPKSTIKGDKTKETYKGGDWVSDKANPFIAPNVEEEIDYAAQGMKYKYAEGGEMDVVAEFTGNELIVNEQSQVEQALANGNYAAAAAPIRRAMGNRQITPGPETHNNNPMPVDSDGNIYAAGGKLNFKVNKGAGVYDHASDQFKPTMTDREISMVISDNMAKWESNNMA